MLRLVLGLMLTSCASIPEAEVAEPVPVPTPEDQVKVEDWSRVQGEAGRKGPTVALNVRRDGIYRDETLLVPLDTRGGRITFRSEDLEGQLCGPLRAALLDARGATAKGQRPPAGDGTVVVRASDGVPFDVIRVILFTASQAGFPQHELQARQGEAG